MTNLEKYQLLCRLVDVLSEETGRYATCGISYKIFSDKTKMEVFSLYVEEDEDEKSILVNGLTVYDLLNELRGRYRTIPIGDIYGEKERQEEVQED